MKGMSQAQEREETKGLLSRKAPLLVLLALGLLLASCGSPKLTVGTPVPGGRITLTGAGATFPYPLYSKMFAEYSKVSNTDVNYQSIGSGGGIRQIKLRTVDFGASDGILTPRDEAEAPGRLLHIPLTSGAIAVVYNLPGVTTGLRLTPDVLADIYLKKIAKWNDARLVALNPGLSLPGLDIAVVHRSDGSGTTYIFTNYLSQVSQEWKERVGNATSVNWPGDIGGQGNEGVAGQVRQIPGTIGYVELAYALQNNMTHAALRNQAGSYILPTIEATIAAAQGVELPDDMKVMVADSANPAAYPIAGLTWGLVYQDLGYLPRERANALVNMLWWAIHEGQRYAAPLHYAPLSADAIRRAEALLRSITYQGEPVKQ